MMAALNITKVAVGCAEIETLAERLAMRASGARPSSPRGIGPSANPS